MSRSSSLLRVIRNGRIAIAQTFVTNAELPAATLNRRSIRVHALQNFRLENKLSAWVGDLAICTLLGQV